MGMPAKFKRNWQRAKFSGKSFKDHSVPVNTKPMRARLGAYAEQSKMAPRKSGG